MYPPVDTTFFRPPAAPAPSPVPVYLIVSALVPYKRVDVAIEACRRLGARLRIVGRGPEEARLRLAADSNVEFMGWCSDEDIRDLYSQATAVLLPGTEDFGMVPVEAQACGTPVVAYGEGGACETVVDGETGVLVREDSAAAFADGLDRVRSTRFDRSVIRANAERFSRARFMSRFQAAVASAVAEREVAR